MLPQVVVKLVKELKDKYAVHLICSCLSDTEKYFKAISIRHMWRRWYYCQENRIISYKNVEIGGF